MDPIAQVEQRSKENRNLITEIVRLGTVIEVDATNARLTVESEGIPQANVPFFTTRAGEDMTYWMPSVGELGFLFAPSGIAANSVFLPGIFFNGFPVPETNPALVKRLFRNGSFEEIDTENSQYKLSIGENIERLINTEMVLDSFGDNQIKMDADETLIDRPDGSIKIDEDETSIKRGTSEVKIDDDKTELARTPGKVKIDNNEILLERAIGLIKQAVGTNSIELNTILANIVGAQIFPTGITTFQTAMGPVFFAPAPSPAAAPPPPAAAMPVNGKATRVPPSTVQNVGIPKGTFIVTIPPLTVTGTAGTVPVVGVTAATPATLQVTATGVTLVIPGKAL